MHGTLRWREPGYARQVLLLKYAQAHVYQSMPRPPRTMTLSDQQLALFSQMPGSSGGRSHAADGWTFSPAQAAVARQPKL